MSLNAVRFLSAIASEEPDAELLARFIDRRDEAAFAQIVRRHGAMVYGVCRRLLPEQDAEDAFQTTFLVLARKAQTAAPRDVGNWLFGVARRAALLSRRSIARRRERMGDVPERWVEPDPLRELRAALDEELSRLPDMYRTVLILCDLEERTRREAAAILGCPEGTVAGRLVRGREMLARRLARHAPSVSLVAILAGTASARVPEVLAPTATIPFGVAALTQGVFSVMFRGTLMKTVATVLIVSCTVLGMVVYAGQKIDPDKPAPDKPAVAEAPVKPPKADDVIWGKEVDGLQAGIVAATRVYRPGETVKMEVRLRNVGKADITIKYGLLQEHSPQFTDADGVRLTVGMPPRLGIIVIPTEQVLKPGETKSLWKPEVEVMTMEAALTDGLLRLRVPTIYVKPGKYRFAFEGMVHSHPTLSTGTVAFEVKGEKESEIAWGEEGGGLQAGLEIKEKRVYRPGETVMLLVRVRNVGKEAVKFAYIRQYLDENLPGVTGADGKSIPQVGPYVEGLRHVPVEVNLEPGKEVVLETRINGASGQPYELRPADGGGTPATRAQPLKVGTGKIALQYERVFGGSSSGALNVSPALSKLATGKLELEVTDEPPIEKKDGPQPKAKGPVATEKEPPLSSKELVGEWEGEKDGLIVRVKFTGADDARWTVIQVIQPGSDQKTTSVSADMKREDDKPGSVHLRFNSIAKPTGTVLARLERWRGGALKVSILPAAGEINAAYKAVEGLILRKIEPEKKKDAEGFGESVDGLRIKLQIEGRTGGKSPSYFTVVAQNVGGTDLNLRLGESLGNGKTHHPTALRLVLIEGDKKTRFTYAELNVAGRLDPFVVPLPAGSSYTLRCTLNQFVPEKGGEHANLSAKIDVTKEYRVVAELVGRSVTETSDDLRGLKLMQFWKGTAQSNEAEPPPARDTR